ncbi:MAG: hypothetical protein ABWX82_07455 [Leifsonia sp.]
MMNAKPDPEHDTTTDLSSDWVEKDGDVVNEKLEEVLPQSEPTDGAAPLP